MPLKFMVISPFRRLSKGEAPERLGMLGKINKKLIGNPQKEKKL